MAAWSWWSAGSWDFAQEAKLAAAVPAPEGFRLGRLDFLLGALAQEEADTLPGLDGSTGLVAVMSDPGEAFGQDVQAPAADELVGMKVQDGGFAGA